MNKTKKIALVSISSIFILALVVIIFISPITKYLIEKYDEKYTGRQITLDWVYVNPFTGYVHLSNLKIFENKSDSIFFSANSLSINFSMSKLISKTYEISELTIDHPKGIIIQRSGIVNFNDMIEKFGSAKTNTVLPEIHFNILKIKIINGEFHYSENTIPINYFIRNVNFESGGLRWNEDTIAGTFSFLPGIGSGDVKGSFKINLKNLEYSYSVLIHKLDLKLIGQYLKELSNYGSFTANLDADMKATGNFKNQEDVSAKGMIAINNLHFGKNPGNDYVSFDRFLLAIKDMSPLKHIYLYDSVSITRPYFKYELYDNLDNIETMFGKNGANISQVNDDPARFNLILEIARYVKVLARNFFQSYYRINRFAIYNGDLKFNDYSLNEKFSIDLNPLSVIADSIDKNNKRVNVFLKSGIQPFGNAFVDLSISPNDTGEFDLRYGLQKLSAPMFNPYIIKYSSFPLDRGSIELNGLWNVRKGNIQSENHFLIIDPRLTSRIRNKNISWLPMKLVMALIREKGNVIDYEIPITGNLKKPDFHLHDVITDMLENIFIKPTTTSYRMQIKNVETEIEKSLSIKWGMRNSKLTSTQEKFIGKMAEFLKKNPDASINISVENYSVKEQEYILFFEAKKKYYIDKNQIKIQSFTEDDSERVDKMSVKDSLFIRYLNKMVKDSLIFTVQEKCRLLINSQFLETAYNRLKQERENVFISQFKKNNVENRVTFLPARDVIPFNGFSFYKIKYIGELPDYLLKAYKEMNEFNDESPRDKFKNDREKNISIL